MATPDRWPRRWPLKATASAAHLRARRPVPLQCVTAHCSRARMGRLVRGDVATQRVHCAAHRCGQERDRRGSSGSRRSSQAHDPGAYDDLTARIVACATGQPRRCDRFLAGGDHAAAPGDPRTAPLRAARARGNRRHPVRRRRLAHAADRGGPGGSRGSRRQLTRSSFNTTRSRQRHRGTDRVMKRRGNNCGRRLEHGDLPHLWSLVTATSPDR